MKLTHYIYISTALTMLTACGDDIDRVYTVGEADNAIVLMAGVREGGESVQTRAIDGNHASSTTGGGHVPFTSGTKLALRVDGTWLDRDPVDIKNSRTATVGTESSTGSKHNVVSFDAPGLYWDDYGTADPDNMPDNPGNGRQKGLTIYGAAVDGVKSSAPTVSDWTSLSWTLAADQRGGWAEKDLLTSNNITESADGTYKFDERNNTTDPKPSNLLEFTHAMSKVTVKLVAGEGFVHGYFEEEASVTLKNFYLTGTVNVESKFSTPTKMSGEVSTATDVKTYLESGVIGTSSETSPERTLTYSALVYPGKSFTSTEDLLTLTADGNTYKVTAAKLFAAMTAAEHSSLLQGYNYILNITVNKTKVDVDATIVDWKKVEAAEIEKPEIDIDYVYGHEASDTHTTCKDFGKGFEFYRSTTLEGSYLETIDHSKVLYSASAYTLSPQLYWPNHSIHYYFRGVWPLMAENATQIEDNQSYIPSAKLNNGSSAVSKIDVTNVPYNEGTYPSDLMIGRPLKEDGVTPDEACKVNDHKINGAARGGICATRGKIHMNFHYMMSQVKVELQTSEVTAKDHVTFNNKTKVEIVDGYSAGAILLGSCTSDFTGKIKSDYVMHNLADGDYDSYHDAVIPQSLVSITETDGVQTKTPTLKFRITVEDENGFVDVYETVLGISEIMVKEQTSPDEWGEAKKIDAWEPGKIYTYTLMITKTGIQVKATLTDWIPVKADDIVWF